MSVADLKTDTEPTIKKPTIPIHVSMQYLSLVSKTHCKEIWPTNW